MSKTNLRWHAALIAGTAFLLFVIFRPDTRPELTVQLATAPLPTFEAAPATLDGFGFSSRAFEVETTSIARGDTYAGLFAAMGMDAGMWKQIEDNSAGVLGEMVLRAGNVWHVYRTDGVAHHAVYEVDVRRYVVFSLGDSPQARMHEHPVTRAERTVTGTINNSLYATLDAAGASSSLAPELAAIFGAQIDFYRLQKGDKLAVVFEEERIGERVVGAGKILAARLVHAGQSFEAFRFEQDGLAGYYDAKGKNVENGFLKSPLKFSRMTSGFTMRRFHPVQKRWKAHLGTDYAAPTGTPILAVGNGVVSQASRNRGNGNFVKIRHDRTYETQYLHMSRFAKGIRPGGRVQKGDVIGYVGATGLATGPHVCFRFWKNGVQVDHRRELGPEMPPVMAENRAAFQAEQARLESQLTPASILAPVRAPLFNINAVAAPANPLFAQ